MYAAAHAGIAAYYFVLGTIGVKPPNEILPLAKSAAEKALAIETAGSLALSILTAMTALSSYDWK